MYGLFLFFLFFIAIRSCVCFFFFFFYCYGDHRDLHSFPTRRSSDQHLSMVRMRAAENRRWLLRATNDGITTTIDSAGRLRGSLPKYVQATSYTGFNYVSGQTAYTLYGDWFPWLCAVG